MKKQQQQHVNINKNVNCWNIVYTILTHFMEPFYCHVIDKHWTVIFMEIVFLKVRLMYLCV